MLEPGPDSMQKYTKYEAIALPLSAVHTRWTTCCTLKHLLRVIATCTCSTRPWFPTSVLSVFIGACFLWTNKCIVNRLKVPILLPWANLLYLLQKPVDLREHLGLGNQLHVYYACIHWRLVSIFKLLWNYCWWLVYLVYGEHSISWSPRICSHEVLQPSATRQEKLIDASFISISCLVHKLEEL